MPTCDVEMSATCRIIQMQRDRNTLKRNVINY